MTADHDNTGSRARRAARQPRRERLSELLRWSRLPGALRYTRHHGVVALLRRLFPGLPSPRRDYATWIKLYDQLTDNDRRAIAKAIDRLVDPPVISVLMPVYETPERYLRAAIELVCRQLYPLWELCIADDASPSPHIRAVIEEYRAGDARIKVCYRSHDGHVSAASNSALTLAEGRFVALLYHDDLLAEHALYMVAATLAREPDLDLVFSDEDKIDPKGNRFDPYFKSDWNPDLMLSWNSFSHLGVYRRSLVNEIGGFRVGYEGSQDYDLVLRASARTAPERIGHVRSILYHGRAIPGSVDLRPDEESDAVVNARRALADHLRQKGVAATVSAGASPHFHRVRYRLPEPAPGVSLIVPTRDRADLLRRCVDGLLNETDYDALEVVIVDNNSAEADTHAYFAELAMVPNLRIVSYPGPFNYSAINNFGVAQARYSVIGFLNNDIEVIHAEWLREMVSHAVRPEVGAVGAKLYYPDDTVQHAGTILGLGAGTAGHAFRHFRRGEPGYCGRLLVTQDLSAVTAACMVLRRRVFDEVGGFDEVNLPVAFNDVDLCLRIQRKGLPHYMDAVCRAVSSEIGVARLRLRARKDRALQAGGEIPDRTVARGDR